MSYAEIEYRERNKSWDMSDLQCHDHYELYFLIEGQRSFFYEDRMFSLSAGSFCVIPPYAMHKTSGGAYKRININLSPELLLPSEREFLSGLRENCAYSLGKSIPEPLLFLLSGAADIQVADPREKHAITLAYVHTLLSALSKTVYVPVDHGARTASASQDTLILKIVSYLNSNYSEKLDLRSIGERFYISKNTLSKRFRAAMSCSVTDYLSLLRLKCAKELLKTTDKSMSEVAALCGYSSANYFSLIFKKSVGISPGKYRNDG